MKKNYKKSETLKRTGEDVYIGKYEHIFNHKWTDNEIKALADELIEWLESDVLHNIWYKDFFNEKKISGQRLSEFRERNTYFNYVLTICDGLQESRLFKAGANRKLNPAMFIMALKNFHKWQDHQELNVKTEDTLNIQLINIIKGLNIEDLKQLAYGSEQNIDLGIDRSERKNITEETGSESG